MEEERKRPRDIAAAAVEEEWGEPAPGDAPEAVPPGGNGHQPSDVDAMGKDKRRQVVGQTYGPTLARQLTLYGIFVAVVAALFLGGLALVHALDKPPEHIPNSAPWSKPGAKQIPPKPLQ